MLSFPRDLRRIFFHQYARKAVDGSQRRAEIVRNRIGEGFQFVVGGFQLSGAFLNAFLQLRVDRAHFLLRAFVRPLLSVPLHPGFEDRRQVPSDALQRLQIALAVIRRFVGDSKKSDRFPLKKDGHCENPADGSAARRGRFWFVGIQRSPFSKRASPDANPLAAPEANSLAGNLAILPSLPLPDGEYQRAIFVDVAEDPLFALGVLQDGVQHGREYLTLGQREKYRGEPGLEGLENQDQRRDGAKARGKTKNDNFLLVFHDLAQHRMSGQEDEPAAGVRQGQVHPEVGNIAENKPAQQTA